MERKPFLMFHSSAAKDPATSNCMHSPARNHTQQLMFHVKLCR